MTLTPLQFAVLSLIDRKTPGATVRAMLASRFGIDKSGPSFYQAMARMEGEGWVKGEYVQSLVDGQPIKERVYSLTPSGAKVLAKTKEFYRS
jgi:DNA-binding PadR family transcriptional regulator